MYGAKLRAQGPVGTGGTAGILALFAQRLQSVVAVLTCNADTAKRYRSWLPRLLQAEWRTDALSQLGSRRCNVCSILVLPAYSSID